MMRRAVLVALLLVPAAAGQAIDDDWQQQERSVEIRQTPSGVESTSESADGGDRIDVTLDAAAASTTYRFRGDGVDLTVEQRVVAIVEWEDTDGDGRYGVGDRTVHRTSLQGNAPAVQLQETATGHRVDVRYTVLGEAPDGDPLDDHAVPTGGFVLSYEVLERPLLRDGVLLAPTQLPITLATESYPFREDGTGVAFEVRVTTSDAMTRAAIAPITISERNHTTYYDWSEEGLLDGLPIDPEVTHVVASPDAPTQATLYHAFGHGDAQQDATIGTQRTITRIGDGLPVPGIAGNGLLFGVGILGMAAIVGVPAVKRMGRP